MIVLPRINRHVTEEVARPTASELKVKLMKKEKSKRLASNIDSKGRLFRAGGAVVIGIAAIVFWPKSTAVGVGLALASAFLAFEAARGWCGLRACGVKTKF